MLIAGLAATLNVFLAVGLNQILLPLYLDSLFTMLVTLLFGPVAGLLSATFTNIALHLFGSVHIAFVLCHYLTVGVVWGYKRLYGPEPQFVRFLGMGLVAGFGNGLLGSFIAIIVFDGIVEYHIIDHITEGLLLAGQGIYGAVFSAGMVTNLMDKAVSASAVFLAIEWATRQPRLAWVFARGTRHE